MSTLRRRADGTWPKYQWLWHGWSDLCDIDECEECGRGRFNWRRLWPMKGAYSPESRKSSRLFRWIVWGPLELRIWDHEKTKNRH